MYSSGSIQRLNNPGEQMGRFLPVLGLILASSLSQALAAPQNKRDIDNTVRSVQGVVLDDAGKPVPGAIVHIENTKTLQILSFITKDDGSYAFHGLSSNVDYALKAEYQNMTSNVKTLSVFDSRRNAVINLKLNKKKS
jgi:hypothetical protein